MYMWTVLPKYKEPGDKLRSFIETCHLFDNTGAAIMKIHFDYRLTFYIEETPNYEEVLEKSIVCWRENSCQPDYENPTSMTIHHHTHVNVTHVLMSYGRRVKLWIHPRVLDTFNFSHVPVTTIDIDHFEPYTKHYLVQSFVNFCIDMNLVVPRVFAWVLHFFDGNENLVRLFWLGTQPFDLSNEKLVVMAAAVILLLLVTPRE